MTVFVILVCLIVVAAILMCFIVLIQNSKGGGLAAGFASSNQIMGVRKTTDVLEKATWGLAIFMVVVSVISAYALPTAGQQDSVLLQEAQRESQTNPQGIPGFDASKVNPAEQQAPAQGEAPAAATEGNAAEQPAAPAQDE